MCIARRFPGGGDSSNTPGEAALKQQPRGAKFCEGRTLSAAESATVQRLLIEHFPNEVNIDSALWTRSALQTLIACECGVEMPIRTVGEYLQRRYTPQKPLKRAYEQDPQAVTWLETTYSALEQRALQEDAELAWGDESGLRDAQVGRGYAPIGQTPEIQPSTQRVRVNYIASISNSRQSAVHALYPNHGTSVHHLPRTINCKTQAQVDVDCRSTSRASFRCSATVVV